MTATAAPVPAEGPLPGSGVARALGRLATRVVAVLVAVVVLGVLVVALVIPVATGGSARVVRTGSMAPGLPVGSLIVDRPVAAARLHVGDVATYVRRDDETVTHRIVGIRHTAQGLSFTFRGDANRSADPEPVAAANVLGRVILHVPVLGAIGDRMAHAKWVLIGVAVVVLAAYAVRQAAGGLREIRERR